MRDAGDNGQARVRMRAVRARVWAWMESEARAWAGRTCGLRVLMLERLPSGSMPMAWRVRGAN